MSEVFKPKVYKPAEENDDKISLIKNNIPAPIFRWILIGCTGCGKSNLIKNLLFNSGYEKYFDEIIIYSGSIDDCCEYLKLARKHHTMGKTQIRQVFNQEEFKDCVMGAREQDIARTGSTTTTLLVLDDQITNQLCKPTKLGIIDEIFVRGRHLKISVIIASQKYMSLNQNIRQLNLSALTVFNNTSQRDLDNIAKEHCNAIDEDSYKKLIVDNIDGQYSYITINKKTNTFYDSTFDEIGS